MVRYKNKFRYPAEIVKWLTYDEYDHEPGVISATKLLSPARQYALYKKHAEELETDVSDLIASRFGTAQHASFEKIPFENVEQETRLYVDVVVDDKEFKISGKFDMMRREEAGDTLIDIKTTSVWAWIFDSKTEDYIKQLSIYRYLANNNCYDVGEIAEIFMIFTDWSSGKAKKDPSYPQSRIKVKHIKLWSEERTEEFIKERLMALYEAENVKIPLCSQKELWTPDTKYAVMKKGNKRAVAVLDTKEKAMLKLEEKELGDKGYIEERKGKAKRCNYCMARKFCDQYKEMLSEGLVEE